MAAVNRQYLETLVCEKFLTNERYRRGHLSVLAVAPGTDVIGLHTPRMKMVARMLVSDGSWRPTLDRWSSQRPLVGAGGLSHEERMIWGLVIDFVRCSQEERFQLIDEFLPSVDNWAICDTFCCNSKWAEKEDKELLWTYLERLFHSRQQWSIRVATILSMCHFIDSLHIWRTFSTIDGLNLQENEPYYVRMGIAWLLATALAGNPEATRSFVRGCHLPKDILKLYVRKARESRITRNMPAL